MALDTNIGYPPHKDEGEMKVSGVYVIRNVRNGKVYVGKSVDVHSRWQHHRARLTRGVHINPHLQAAWNLDGATSFVFEVVQEGSPQDLPALERDWIISLRGADRASGYNLDLATPSGYAMSAETRAKISAANRGKVRTPEMRATMREIKLGQGKGRVKSPQEIENLKKAWLTRGPMPPVSQETRDKLRSAGVQAWEKRKNKGGVSSH